jgi:hypothetical protein
MSTTTAIMIQLGRGGLPGLLCISLLWNTPLKTNWPHSVRNGPQLTTRLKWSELALMGKLILVVRRFLPLIFTCVYFSAKYMFFSFRSLKDSTVHALLRLFCIKHRNCEHMNITYTYKRLAINSKRKLELVMVKVEKTANST